MPTVPTPLVELSLRIGGRTRRVTMKLEGANATGSLKMRTARALMQSLDDAGRLNARCTIVESSSGNLAIALAELSRQRGLRFIAVVEPRTQPEMLAQLQALGADVDVVPCDDPDRAPLSARLDRVAEICARSSQFVWTDQYSNPANPVAHYRGTAPEIDRQMSGQIDAVYVAVSTGGTLAGIGRYFREARPATQIVGVDVDGSVVFGGQPNRRMLTGIGSSQSSSFLDPSLYDDRLIVAESSAIATCRELMDRLGLSIGGSSGAVLHACARHLLDNDHLRRVVCLSADGGSSYASTIFNDQWVAERRVPLGVAALWPIEEILTEDRAIEEAWA